MEWMILPLKRYFDFAGRSRRKEYWMFWLLLIGVYLVLGAITLSGMDWAGIMAEDPDMMPQDFGPLTIVGFVLFGIFALAIFIPSIAVTIRRFHDRDMSGWWYLGFLVASAVPVVGFIASIALIVLMAMPGTPGPNRFGPDPKDPSQATVFA